MPVALILIGSALGMAAWNDKVSELGTLIKGDLFSNGQQSGFLVWIFAVLCIAAIFKAVDLPEVGYALLVLVLIAYLLGNANIPGQIAQQIQSVGGGTPSGTNNPGGGVGSGLNPQGLSSILQGFK